MHSNAFNRKSFIGIYGNITIIKEWCSSCERIAFLIDGTLQCCGKAIESAIPQRYKREILPDDERRLPPINERKLKLAEQDGRCFYCEQEIGSFIKRNNKLIRLRLHWDHQVPYSYSQNNKASNFVAACHVCNGIKSSYCFQTVEEARIYVQEKRKEKGYMP